MVKIMDKTIKECDAPCGESKNGKSVKGSIDDRVTLLTKSIEYKSKDKMVK